jgi:hypothetical protein
LLPDKYKIKAQEAVQVLDTKERQAQQQKE